MTTTKTRYEISGYSVDMTDDQAARWNAGDITDAECGEITLYIPVQTNHYREMTLAAARDDREIGAELDGMPANRIS